MFGAFLTHYIDSTSMLQKLLSGIIADEWAQHYENDSVLLIEKHHLATTLTQKMLTWLQGAPPSAYHEMAVGLGNIQIECTHLLQSFNLEAKLPASSIPKLGEQIDVTGQSGLPNAFTLESAQHAVNGMYNNLKAMLGKTKKKEQVVIAEKRAKVVIAIERYVALKGQYDVRVAAAFASAFVSFRPPVDKVGPIVKGIMNGVKVSSSPHLSNEWFID
jgi:TATA-binding protein-associated factor